MEKLTLLSNFSNTIFLIYNNITRQDGGFIINHDLRVVQTISRLPIHTVITLWGGNKVGLVCLNDMFLPREDITEEHGSVGVGPSCVVVTLGGMWRQVETISKPLEFKIFPY